MSRQLNRIRSLIADIEEIQKKGQSVQEDSIPGAGASFHSEVTPVFQPPEFNPEQKKTSSQPRATTQSKPESAVAEPGLISVSLAGNVVLQLSIEGSYEVVRVKQIMVGENPMIEIQFSDGKAVHLPIKTVA